MRFVILGAGAIGCYVGGRLAAQHGTRAPRNAAMYRLVQRHRKGERMSAAAMRSAALL